MKKLCMWVVVTLGVLASMGCGSVPGSELKDVDREQVVQASGFDFLPPSARHVHYWVTSFQDKMEVFYFRAPRKDVDAFSIRLLGFVPEPRDPAPHLSSWLSDRSGWPHPPKSGGRYGTRNESEVGLRKVVVADGPEYSEVWVMVSNWCNDCESADLTGKPPQEDSTITYGPGLPPPLPPPPPRR